MKGRYYNNCQPSGLVVVPLYKIGNRREIELFVFLKAGGEENRKIINLVLLQLEIPVGNINIHFFFF